MDDLELIHRDLMQRATSHFKLKAYDEALAYAKRAYDLGIHPDKAAAAMAGLSKAKGDYEEAKRWAAEAMQAGGDSYYPLRYLWHALWMTDSDDEADGVAARLESLVGPSAETQILFALTATHRFRFRVAARHMRRGAALDPDHLGPARSWPVLAALSLNPFDLTKSLINLASFVLRRMRKRWRKLRGTP